MDCVTVKHTFATSRSLQEKQQSSYFYDCVFSRLGEVSTYMTSAYRSYCGPVIKDTQLYGTLKQFIICFLSCYFIS